MISTLYLHTTIHHRLSCEAGAGAAGRAAAASAGAQSPRDLGAGESFIT